MKESIYFPEDKIPRVVSVIRRGLKTEKDKEVKRALEKQCKELEAYWKRCQEA
jgi:hypothetical protein